VYPPRVHPTVASALLTATQFLAEAHAPGGGCGSPTPRSDAEELLSRLLGVTRLQLRLQGERVLAAEESSRLESWLQRRAAHEPVQYITGKAAFRDLDLDVTRDVLIPRPETEGLVEAVLEALRLEREAWPAPRTLDLGTGSGAIALALASEWPAAVVTASDASRAALALARANAGALGLDARIRFLAGDWFAPLGADERFEVVVSNPPYVAPHEWDVLPEDVRAFEPREALLSGERGLDAVRHIMDGAPARLVPDGLLALELAEARAHEVLGWFVGADAWADVALRDDLSGRPRYLLALRAE